MTAVCGCICHSGIQGSREMEATIADLRSQLEALQTKLEETRSQRDSYKDVAEELESQLEAAQLEAAQWAYAEFRT